MAYEDLILIISELKKKIYYIAIILISGVILSFSLMGRLISRIQSDMFWHLNLYENNEISRSLDDISGNIAHISEQLSVSYPVISQNLTQISGDLLNISRNINLQKPAIVYLSPMEVLMLEFKMSLLFGIIITLPVILYFVYMGLRPRLMNVVQINRSLIISTIIASLVLFSLGATYSYNYMLPFFLGFLYQDAINVGVNATFSVYSFVHFIVSTTVLIGLAFELPVILTLLVHLGITTRQHLAYYRRHAYIVLLIIAAVITPDPTFFSQIMVTVPFIVLYEVSLLMMRLTGK